MRPACRPARGAAGSSGDNPPRCSYFGYTRRKPGSLSSGGTHGASRCGPGGGKPDTFDFLCFTHICATSQRGRFTIHLRTMRKRLRRGILEISQWCQDHRHDPVAQQRETLNRKLHGHYNYYGRPTNYSSLWRYFRLVRRVWKKWLNRRTRGKTLNWTSYGQVLERHPLVRPYISRPWVGAGSHA